MTINLSLNGDWQLKRSDLPESISAQVPGCVHLDLMRAGQIPDLLYRDNEVDLLWIGENDWQYQRTFTVTAELLEEPHVYLVCEGLDTLASLVLNGVTIGSTDNMYRSWEFDVKEFLRLGSNEIAIHFASPMRYLRHRDATERILPAWIGPDKVHGGGWLRKEPCNFGWDWGPRVVTSGIWRNIGLRGFTARLTELYIEQRHEAGQVTLGLRLNAEYALEAYTAKVYVSYEGLQVASSTVSFSAGAASVQLSIENPKLWWLNGMGEQALYTVRVELLDGNNQIVDFQEKRIGLRTLVLDRHADEWGESFQFLINGIPFFAKGANWIPADIFASRMRKEAYESLIQAASDAHMNMLRVWGGGIYEQDEFYDLCDEYGIALWQDFMFACATYPGFDAAYCENVRLEAIDNVRRLRHHPSIALWCGNNELEQGLVGEDWTDRTMSWQDYSTLFDQILPEVIKQHDPDRSYWPCSPHNPTGNRYQHSNPESGDAHLWDVWHGKKPFEWYRTCLHRFVSEFGFQSFPEPATMNSVIEEDDRNITSFVMEYRQRSGIGNTTIMQYLLDWFRLPVGYEESLWLTQILQGMAMKYAIEHWRRNMPRTMGTLYWQLNDCWEAPSWASIDYQGQWKALHFMAKRFYAPILISGLESLDEKTVDIYVTSDQGLAKTGLVRWLVTTANGDKVEEGTCEILSPIRGTAFIQKLDLSNAIHRYGSQNLLVWLTLELDNTIVSDNLVLFARPKHLKLVDPQLKWEIRSLGEGKFEVRLKAEKPALWVWLSSKSGHLLSKDNFFHLQADEERTLTVELADESSITIENIQAEITVQSLIDTYRKVFHN